MGAILQLPLGHLPRGDVDARRPLKEVARRPGEVGLVPLGHVLVQGREAPRRVARVRRHPLAHVEHFDHGVGQADLQHLADQAGGTLWRRSSMSRCYSMPGLALRHSA